MSGHVTKELVRMHDGLLDEDRIRAVRAHLAGCADCREADDAIAFSREMLATLTPKEMPDRDRIRAAVVERRPSPRRWFVGRLKPAASLAAAAAAIALLAWLAWPRVRFVDAPRETRSMERIAVEATRRPAARRTDSLDVARRIIRGHSGVAPAFRGGRVVGVTAEQGAVSTAVFEIGARPVVLAIARSSRIADAPPESFRAKRLEVRHGGGGLRTFTWTASGDAYSLAVPPGVDVADACAICHEGSATLRLIRRATATRAL